MLLRTVRQHRLTLLSRTTFCCLAGLGTGTVCAQTSIPVSPAVVADEVIVGVDSTQDSVTVRRELEAKVGRVLGKIDGLNAYRVRPRGGVRAATGGFAAVARTARNNVRGIRYVEPNYVVTAFDTTPNDTYYLSHQYAPQKVQANLAWPLWTPRVTTVIAIIDTGVNMTHPDLANKIYRDSNGAVIGYDYVNYDADPTDDHGHGTHCAGISAAQINDGVGIAGIAGWNGNAAASDTATTKIMPIKVLAANGNGASSGVAAGVNYAADNGAKVISLSLGGAGRSQTLSNAIARAQSKGCIVVAAAGNNGNNVKQYPGADTGVISVAATDSSDTLAWFSTYGDWVTCAAPGVDIISTYGNSYGHLSGTSMATPLVAGQVALLASQAGTLLTNVQLRDIVLAQTDAYVPLSGRAIATGAGRVNVLKSLQAVIVLTTPTVVAAPTDLTATAGSRSVIKLAWTDNATNETGYLLERSGDGMFYKTIATLPANTTAYTNTGLFTYTRYYYRIRALGNTAAGLANSPYSNFANARTLSW